VAGRPAYKGIMFIFVKDTFNDSESESESKVKQTVTIAVVVSIPGTTRFSEK
jgi:hypothetical protein